MGGGGGGGGGALSFVVDHTYSAGVLHSVSDQIQNLQNCYTSQTRTPVKTTFRDWCLYSSFVHGTDVCSPTNKSFGFEKLVPAFRLTQQTAAVGDRQLLSCHYPSLNWKYRFIMIYFFSNFFVPAQ